VNTLVYSGLQWFKELRSTFKLHFIVRVKKGIYHKEISSNGGKTQAEMIKKLKRNKRKKMVSQRIVVDHETYYYIIVRNPKAGQTGEDDFIFLLTSWVNRAQAQSAYEKRWSIEVTFRHLKTNGFNLEQTRLEGKHKRELVMMMLNLLFTVCIIEGKKFYQRNPKSKQMKVDHKTGKTYQVHSDFRVGFSIVLNWFASLSTMRRRFLQIMRYQKLPDWSFV